MTTETTELKIKVSSDSGSLNGIKQAENAIKSADALNKKAAKTAAQLGREYRLTAQEVEQLEKRLKEIQNFDLDRNGKLRDAQGQFVKIRNLIEESKVGIAALSEETQAFVAALSGGLAVGVGGLFATGLQGFAQFEQYEAVLTNTLGSAAEAEKALAQIEKFASTTPFQLNEVVEGFIKLQNRGIKPTNDVLTQLGDLASSQGKQLDQVVEAVLDAQSGEFERLKEFGITAETAGNQVTLAFKGVEQTVARTPEALTEAVLAFGALDGVAGQMATQSEILVGRFSNLQDETGKTTRVFGEFAAAGARPVVEAAISLLQTFNELPAPIQAVLVASTAFTGVLAAAVAAIAAYNLANGQRITQELAAAIATVKGNAALAAKTVSTQAAIAVQAAYATATGTATAAQVAQTQALAASAVKLGAFAGAIASIAVAVDTYNKVTAAGNQLKASTDAVTESLLNLRKASDAGGVGNVIGDEASRNAQQLQEELGGVQNAIDKVRGLIPGLATAQEAATNRAIVAFGELTLAVGEVEGESINVLRNIAAGAEVPGERVEETVAAIESSIEALQNAKPVTEEEIRLRDAQIARLEDYKTSLQEAANENNNLTLTTEQLETRVKALTAALKDTQAELQGAALASEAAIKEDIANGVISLEEGQKRLQNTETRLLEDRIASARAKIDELNATKAQTEDPEAIEAANREILALENQVNQDRIALADQRIQAQKSAETDSVEVAADAADQREQVAKDEAAERQRIAEEAAKAETDALKEARDEQKRLAEEQFGDQQDAREDERDASKRLEERRFEDDLQARRESGQAQIEDLRKQSQELLQADAEAFQKRQQADERAFQKALDAERDRESSRIDAAASEAEFQTSLRLADSDEERDELIAAREQAQKRAEILAEEEAKALRTVRESDVPELSPVEQARLDLEERIAAKQQAFQDQQQADAEAFEDQQQAQREADELAINQIEKDFQDQLQSEEDAFNERQRLADQAFQDAQQQRERTFKEEQRRLDKENAEAIARILESARPQGIDGSLRKGGDVEAGGLYRVHKDEFFIPNQNGTILSQRESRAVVADALSARETAAMMSGDSLTAGVSPQAVGVSMRGVERRLDELIELVESDRQVQAKADYTIINQGPPADPVDMEQRRIEGLARRKGF